jgi:hypothetical protein
MKVNNRSAGRRSMSSRAKSLIGVGLGTALLLGGVALVGVLPAAATATLTFSTAPTGGTAGSALPTFDVSGGTSGDVINITSSCTLSGGTDSGTYASSPLAFSNVIITTGASCTITATDQTQGGAVTSSAIAIAPAGVHALVFTVQPASAGTYGVAIPFTVSIEDQYGNVETGDTSSVAITTVSSGCTLAGTPTSEGATAGVAAFSGLNFSAGTPCAFTAADSTDSLSGVASSNVALSSNTATQVAFKTEPAGSVAAGTVLGSFTVAVEQSNGIVVSSATGNNDVITLSALPTTCKLGGTTSATAVAGIATFSALTITTTGSCALIATDTTRTLATASSSAVTVTPGAATHLAFTTAPPATVTGTGTPLTSFQVAVEDVNNNVVTTGTGATDTIVLSSPCGISGTTSLATTAGVATFAAVTYTGTGTCVLTATDSSRTLTTATATTSVGQPQATLVVSSKLGYKDAPLTLATTGGSGTGAVTFTVTNGTATGCLITSGALTATTTGTCIVTATKAAASPYASATSAATTVTISSAAKAVRVGGSVTKGKKSTLTISGYNFSGRPKLVSNVAGFKGTVTRDTGRALTVSITVTGASKSGVKVLTLVFANGNRTTVKYIFHS